MIRTLENKLFQYEIAKKGKCDERYMLYLSEDIFWMVNIAKRKELLHLLTPYDRKILEEIKDKYKDRIFLSKAC